MISLKDIVDTKKIEEIMNTWSTACNMATICLDANGEYVSGQIGFTDFCTKYTRLSEEGEKRCRHCDRYNNGVYYCHAGLIDFGFDIVLDDGQVVGRIIGGQVLSKPVDEDRIMALADELEIPRNEYLDAVRRVPIRDEQSIPASAFLLDKMLNYLVNAEYSKLLKDKHIDRLDKISKTDSLSGLFNNKYCKNYVENLISQKKPFALYIFDLDNFKIVNDTYGHVFGDEVIKRLSMAMDALKPKGAIVGRYGGDEFLVIAPSSSYEDVQQFAQVIQKSVKLLRFEEQPDFSFTTSIGVAIYPNNGDNTISLFENADFALYHVKSKGGDGYLIYKNSLRKK